MTATRSITAIFATFAALTMTSAAFAADAAKPAAPQAPAAPAAPAAPVYREFIYGDPKSKVTVIEYASLTCGFCKQFHDNVFPQIKKNYIDTNKIRFVYRDFPLDGLGAGAAQLARCASGDRGKVMIDLMFKNQQEWVRSQNPLEPLRGYAQLAGMSAADVDACLKNEGIAAKIREVQQTASNAYKVQATPTFFVNNDKLESSVTYDALSAAIDKAISAAK